MPGVFCWVGTARDWFFCGGEEKKEEGEKMVGSIHGMGMESDVLFPKLFFPLTHEKQEVRGGGYDGWIC